MNQARVAWLAAILIICAGCANLVPQTGHGRVAVAYAAIEQTAHITADAVLAGQLDVRQGEHVQAILEHAMLLTGLARIAIDQGRPDDARATLRLVESMTAEVAAFLAEEQK
ncbi:MAG TPA: hypothetical protein DCY89_05505 [Gammaproteobacteria bacterium]|nr:hypothetical protein [Gammaproteobacteria bacterium]